MAVKLAQAGDGRSLRNSPAHVLRLHKLMLYK